MDDQEDRIRALAHQLWAEDGCPDGREDEHWFRAADIIRRQDFEEMMVAPNAAMEAEDFAGVDNPDPASRQSDEPVEQRALEDMTAAKVGVPGEAAAEQSTKAARPRASRGKASPAGLAAPSLRNHATGMQP
jgi:hypothetical protein